MFCSVRISEQTGTFQLFQSYEFLADRCKKVKLALEEATKAQRVNRVMALLYL